MNLKDLKGLLKNDAAKARVKRLNEQGVAAIKGAEDGDEKLQAYRKYVNKFYELKEKYPNWEEKLDKPIEYSRFVLDYNEEMYRTIGKASEDFRKFSPIDIYTLKMHGINLRSIEILQSELGKLLPGSEWTNPAYFNTHIREAYELLRQYYPNDEEYDQVFSPKETMISWGL